MPWHPHPALRPAGLLLAALALVVLAGGLLAIGTRPAGVADPERPTGLRLYPAPNLAMLDALLELPLAAGLRIPVARSSVRRLPPDWPQAAPQQAERLRFVRVVLPLVLAANEAILAERRRLRAIPAAGTRTTEDELWLAALAARYGAEPSDRATLLNRVDAVPPSLALAQAIIESGWGRSRFARAGNALFGQWTWARRGGLRPERARAEKGNYAVRAFPHLYAATVHYMDNLNRHPAYAGFRRERARQRAAGSAPSGRALATTLAAYSERGMKNVRLIQAVIRQNRLAPLDQVRLAPPR